MGMKTDFIEYRVVINPDERKDKAASLRKCKEMVERGCWCFGKAPQIEEVTKSYCEYCGAQWRHHQTVYNGGCCEEDAKHKDEAPRPTNVYYEVAEELAQKRVVPHHRIL